MKERHKDFADYWLETDNIYESAIRAGYSEAYAKSSSYKLLENEGIKNYIQERLAEKDAKKIASQDEVLEFLTATMRGEVPDQLGLETSVKDRNKAAELLAKRYGLLTDNINNKGEVNIIFNVPRPPQQGQGGG